MPFVRKAHKKLRKLFPFFVGLLIIAIPLLVLINRNLSKAQAAWLSGGWTYRKAIEITNGSGGELTDFQTKVSVDTATLIEEGKMKADCSDIRFTLANNSMINYWLDKDCNTSSTTFWVKVPSIPLSGTSLFMYYGNGSASSTSNGNDTFVFFDDFNDNDYSANWEAHDRSYTSGANNLGTVETGEQQRIYGTTGASSDYGKGLRTGTSYPTPLVFEMDRTSFSYTGTRVWAFLHLYKDDSNWVSYGGGTAYNNNPNRYGRVSVLNGSRAYSEAVAGTDDYGNHTFTLKHDGTNAIFSVDGTQITSQAASSLTAVKVGTASWVRAATDSIDAQFDNARIRKYASTEPTTILKEEEKSDLAPLAQWRFDEGYSATEQQPQTKLEQQITILDREYGCKGCTDLPTDNSLGIIKWDGTKYPNSTVYFESVMKTGGGASVTAELYTTAGVAVTNATVTSGSWDTTYTRFRSTSPVTLTDGQEYTVRFSSGNGAVANSRINSARLIIIQDSPSDMLTATQTQIEMGDSEMQLLSSATAIDYPKIYQYDQSKFSPSPTTYFEATLKGSTSPTIEQQINITNKTFTATGSTYPASPDLSLGFFHWDADKYPGAQVYLEAVTSSSGWYAHYRLVSAAGATAPGSTSGNNGTAITRSRSGPITLTNDTDYTIQIKNSSIYTTTLYSAKLIIIQSDDTRITTTTTPIEVGSHVTGFTNTSNAPLVSPKYYLYDQDRFSPTPEASGDVRFEASLKIDDAEDTAHAVLINKTSGATVAEVTKTGNTTWGLVTTTNVDGDADWDTTNDDEYEVQVRCTDGNGGGCSGSIANAHILLDQYSASGITDLEVVYPQVVTTVTGTGLNFATKGYFSGVNPEYNQDFATSFASATLKYFYEANIKTTSGTAYAHLYNIERQGSIVTNIPIENGQVVSTSTDYERLRSPDITDQFTYPIWDEAMTMDTALKTSASSGVTASVSNSSVIIQVSNLSTTGHPTAYVDLYNKTDNQVVTGSELSTTSSLWSHVRSNSLALTTGKEYIVRTRSGIDGAPIYLANAKIIHDQESATGLYSTEVVRDMINTQSTNTNSTYANTNYPTYVVMDNYDYIQGFNEIPMYFETTMRTTSGTGYAQVYDTAAIAGTELTSTSVNAYERKRSESSISTLLSVTGANTYTQLKHSATGPNATLVTNSRFLIQNQVVIPNITHDSMRRADGSINGASWKGPEECHSFNCLSFDGIDDHVNVAPGKIQEFGAGDSFTISIWFKTINQSGTLYAKYNANTGTDGGHKIYLENGRIVGAIDDDNTWGPDDRVISTKSYNDNNWHEVMFVKSGTSFIKLYIDGKLEDTDNFISANATLSNTDNTYFGIDGDGVSSPFKGELDTISIYRHAKTATEVAKNYGNKGTGTSVGETNFGRLLKQMKLHWKFDEKTANTCDATNDACDSSGNEVHGRWEGNVTPTSGKYGRGLDFDGTGDYVTTNDTNSISNTFWYDNAYNARKKYLVANTNESALTDYPFQFTVNYINGMQPDFADLLFTKLNGQPLDYWIESKTDSDSAVVWVKIDNLPTSGLSFFMYYGNPTANSASNGENVFQLFDDFSEDKGYTEVGPGNSTYAVSDGVITITETNVGSGMDSGYNVATEFPVISGTQQVRASVNPTVLKEMHGVYFCGNISGYNTATRFYKVAGTQSWGYAAEQAYTGSGLQTVYANLDDFSCTGDVAIMQDDDSTGSAEIQVDYILIRPLAAVEPTVVEADIEYKTTISRPRISISTWVYPETIDETQRTLITRGSAPSYDWLLALSATDPGKILFANGNGNNQKVSTNSITANTWNHIAMVIEATRTKLFINGRYDSEILNSGTTFGINSISVGASNDGSNGFDGRIDDVRIYNSALTLSEIRQLNQYSPGPVAYWKMENDSATKIHDYAGNNLSGNWHGSSTNHYTQGVFGSAANFNGTDDRIIVPYSTYNTFGDSDGTISAWIKTANDSFQILGKNGNTFQDTLQLYLSSGVLAFRAQDDSYNGFNMCFGGPQINDDTWHHIALTLNKTSRTIAIHIDGKNVEVNDCVGAAYTSFADTYDLYLGNIDGTTYATGQIDDVKIYDYVRSPAQITMDMNADHPIPGSPIGSTIGEWEFDEGYGDTAHNGSREDNLLDGNLAGADACPGDSNCPTWSNAGKFGKALYFDGGGSESQDDYVTAGSDTSIDNLEDMTFSAWIYPESTGEGGAGRIFQKAASSINGRGLYINTNNSLGYYHGWSTSTSGFATWVTPNDSISLNTWNHVVVTYNKSSTGNDPSIYINGILQTLNETSAPTGVSGDDSSGTLYFGNRDTLDRTFDGYLDSIKLYNVLLTAEQVKVIYNRGYTAQFGGSGTSATGTPDQSAAREFCIPGDISTCDAPVALWNFDENSTIYANDSSGNGHRAILGADGAGTDVPTWTSGKIGSSLYFDGNDYASVANDGGDLALTTFTISGWIKISNQRATVFYRGHSDGNYNNYTIQLYDGYLVLTFIGDPYSYNVFNSNSTYTWTDGWHHIAVVHTFGSATSTRMYRDGTQIPGSWTTGLGTRTPQYGYNTVNIGNQGTDTTNYYTGQIDHITVYDYERTSAQIAWEYNNGAPVAHYKFDECSGTTANNSAINSNGESAGMHGTITITSGGGGTQDSAGSCESGNTTEAWNNGTDGNFNASLDFDGVNDYVTVDNPTILNGISQATFAFWVKPTALGNYDVMLSKWNATQNGFTIRVRNTTPIGNIEMFVASSLEEGTINGKRTAFSTNLPLVVDNWTHVIAVYDGTQSTSSNRIQFYINGKLVSSSQAGTIPTTMLSTTADLVIANYDEGGAHFNGQMDDVRIYNYAITAEQAKNIYNRGSAVSFE
jgi:hypothetical protein